MSSTRAVGKSPVSGWDFDEHGLMTRREASINDVTIDESERRIFGPRSAVDRERDLPLRGSVVGVGWLHGSVSGRFMDASDLR